MASNSTQILQDYHQTEAEKAQKENKQQGQVNNSIQNLSKINELRSIIIKNKLSSSYVKTEADCLSKNSTNIDKFPPQSINFRRRNTFLNSFNGKLSPEQTKRKSIHASKNKKTLSSPTSPEFKRISLKQSQIGRSSNTENPVDFNASFIVIQKGVCQPRVRASLPCSFGLPTQKTIPFEFEECGKEQQNNSQSSGYRVRKILISQKKMIQQQREFERESEQSNTYRSLSRCQSKSQGVMYQNNFLFTKPEKKSNSPNKNIFNRTTTQSLRLKTVATTSIDSKQTNNKILLTCPDINSRIKKKPYYHQQVRDELTKSMGIDQAKSQQYADTEFLNLDNSTSDGEQISFSNLDTCIDTAQIAATSKVLTTQTSQSSRLTPYLIRKSNQFQSSPGSQKQEFQDIQKLDQFQSKLNSEFETQNKNRYLPKMFKYQNIKLKQSNKQNLQNLATPPQIDQLAQKMKVLSILNYNRVATTSQSPERSQELSSFYSQAKQIIEKKNYSNLLETKVNPFILKVTPPSPRQNEDDRSASLEKTQVNQQTVNTQSSERRFSKQYFMDNQIQFPKRQSFHLNQYVN